VPRACPARSSLGRTELTGAEDRRRLEEGHGLRASCPNPPAPQVRFRSSHLRRPIRHGRAQQHRLHPGVPPGAEGELPSSPESAPSPVRILAQSWRPGLVCAGGPFPRPGDHSGPMTAVWMRPAPCSQLTPPARLPTLRAWMPRLSDVSSHRFSNGRERRERSSSAPSRGARTTGGPTSISSSSTTSGSATSIG